MPRFLTLPLLVVLLGACTQPVPESAVQDDPGIGDDDDATDDEMPPLDDDDTADSLDDDDTTDVADDDDAADDDDTTDVADDDDTADSADDDDTTDVADDDDSTPVEPQPDPGSGICAPFQAVDCGGTYTANTSLLGATDEVDGYSCSPWDATGPEIAYTFVASADGPVSAGISDLQAGQDLDVYIVEDSVNGCEGDNCVAYGNTTAEWDAQDGTTYYVVVDGYMGSEGPFTLDITCGDVVEPPLGDDDDAVEPADDDDAADPIEPADDDDAVDPVDPGDDDDAVDLPGVCAPDTAIGAPGFDSHANDGVGSTNGVHGWACAGIDAGGAEYTYTYTATADGQATANLELLVDEIIELVLGPQEDVAVYVVDADNGCDGTTCEAWGWSTVSWNVTAGSTWYIVVDAATGQASPYELTMSLVETVAPPPPTEELDCLDGSDDDGDGDIDCDDADCDSSAACAADTCIPSHILSCGDTHAWANNAFGSWNAVDDYSCNSWNESGPEYTYLFTAPATGSVTVALTGMDADLDVFVLDNNAGSCDPEGCLAVGNVNATWDAVAGESYYVVVDGYGGAVSNYELQVTCD